MGRTRRIVGRAAWPSGVLLSSAALSLVACGSDIDAPAFVQDCTAPGCNGPVFDPPLPVRGTGAASGDAGVDTGVVVVDAGGNDAGVFAVGPGPGISPLTGQGTNTGVSAAELGPLCPATTPTNGAPCDPVVNSVPCSFGVQFCTCVLSWVCE